VKTECGFTTRAARNYMRAAEFAEGKSETISDLPPATLYLLASKSTPPAVATEIIARVESGEIVSDETVKSALTEHKLKRPGAPRKSTRLDNALEENRALKVENEHYRRAGGDDCGFSRKDMPANIVMVLTRGLSEYKQHAVMVELVRQLGTKKQRAAFGLEDDGQSASPIPTASGAAA
jgi:hypothetical protein